MRIYKDEDDNLLAVSSLGQVFYTARDGDWIPSGQSPDDPKWTLIHGEEPEPKIEFPEPGRWIRAVTYDGAVYEREVQEEVEEYISAKESRVLWQDNGYSFWMGPEPDYLEEHWQVESWEYIERPWKVGDVVPAYTIIERDWYGERADGGSAVRRIPVCAGDPSEFDRKILWIEED